MIHETGTTRVEGYRGIGKRMPVTMVCFTPCVPFLPLWEFHHLAGFVSKWKLCIGALLFEIRWTKIAGPVVLLVSALLTAGYLFNG